MAGAVDPARRQLTLCRIDERLTMDSFASETLLQILSYLGGEDVGRFTRLNSTSRKIIKDNRKYLKYPPVDIDIYNDYEEENEEKKVRTHIRIILNEKKWGCSVNRSKKGDLVVKPWNCYNYKNFYDLFPQDRIPNDSLQSIFDLVLAKGDVASLLVVDFRVESQIEMLSAAVENTPSQIHYVVACPEHANCFTEICNLLTIVGNHKRRKTARTLMEIYCYNKIADCWPALVKFNEIGALFEGGMMELMVDSLGDTLNSIFEKWLKNPFSKFNFNLRAKGKHMREDWHGRNHVFAVFDRNDEFLASTTNKEHFLRITKEDPESCIRVVEQKTGLALQFNKKQGQFIDERFLETEEETIEYVISVYM